MRYMCQTKRKLKTTRIHANDINKRIVYHISNYRLEYDHNFKWDEIKILDNKSVYSKRLISEMVHIKSNKLNKQSDTKSFPNSYIPIL